MTPAAGATAKACDVSITFSTYYIQCAQLNVSLSRLFDTSDVLAGQVDVKLSYRRFAVGAGWTVFKAGFPTTDAQVFTSVSTNALTTFGTFATKYPQLTWLAISNKPG